MKCEACGKKILINYGNANHFFCKKCMNTYDTVKKCDFSKIVKRTVGIMLIVAVSCFVLKIGFEIYGIPFGKYIAKKNIEEYILFQYPRHKLSIDKIVYNPKNAEYHTKILNNKGGVFSNIEYFWKRDSLHDGRFNELLDKTFDESIQNEVQELSKSIVVIDSLIWTEIKTNLNFNNNNIQRNDTMYITIKNKEENLILTKKQYIDLVKKIINYLKYKNYQIYKIQIEYIEERNNIKNNSYLLLLNKKQINLPKEEIIKYINRVK